MRWIPCLLLALVPLTAVRAAPPALLSQAVDRWIGERNQWAFTQFVREFDGTLVAEERHERYDPSQPGEKRWQLLSVNGQRVSSASDAGRELQKIPAGRIARLLVWRGDAEIFLTVKKEKQ